MDTRKYKESIGYGSHIKEGRSLYFTKGGGYKAYDPKSEIFKNKAQFEKFQQSSKSAKEAGFANLNWRDSFKKSLDSKMFGVGDVEELLGDTPFGVYRAPSAYYKKASDGVQESYTTKITPSIHRQPDIRLQDREVGRFQDKDLVIKAKQQENRWGSKFINDLKKDIRPAELPFGAENTRAVLPKGVVFRKEPHSAAVNLEDVVKLPNPVLNPYYHLHGHPYAKSFNPYLARNSLPPMGLGSAKISITQPTYPSSAKYEFNDKDYQLIGIQQKRIDQANENRSSQGRGQLLETAAVFPSNHNF